MDILGNPPRSYGMALALFTGGAALAWGVQHVLMRRLSAWAARTASSVDDLLVAALRRTLVPLLYFGAAVAALQQLTLGAGVRRGLTVTATALAVFFLIRFVDDAVRLLVLGVWVKKHADETLERQVKGLMPIVTTLIWVGGGVLLLDNLGFKVSTVMAGLGIGGVAVALASQSILADLFSYFSIAFDRPFEVGDFIVVGEFSGTVEQIGIKSTHLRSLGGEELVFSNTDLTGSRIRNYKRMEIRRAVFTVGVTYGTPRATLADIPALLRAAMAAAPRTRVDRAHLASFGESSVVFECVYYVLSSDYNVYMDAQEKINLAILEAFERRGIEFAFPTRTVHVRGVATRGFLGKDEVV